MLQLKNVTKDYVVNSELTVQALKGVTVDFRSSEFVSILGPSGCGKTTLLNIIGGLDQYTSGDLVIDGVSTKDYKDRDWDTYRNHSIGFVFQTYNLIPHQTVLKNVELALTLAGVNKTERRKRAEEALQKVGLGDQLNKRPNQMSGGQMQRVAIARALVNNPDIVLADEPTGALDTETGVQVMEILKEVAKDRLVIMVTHNPELAEKYSTRIIRALDGLIVDDSHPLSNKEYKAEKAAEDKKAEEKAEAKAQKKKGSKKEKRSSMSFWTAFKLSLNNLFTKKGRTILTSFAGSIGIIGIALILSVSQGMSSYIDLVQEQTLTSYPLSIQSTAMDLTSLVATMMEDNGDYSNREEDMVYQRSIVDKIANIIDATAHTKNDLKAFKEFLENQVADKNSKLHGAVAGLQYQYDLDILVYTKKHGTNEVQKADPAELIQKVVARVLKGNASQVMGGYYSSMGTFSMNLWQELLPDLDGGAVNKLLYDQYTLEYGAWPKQANEVVLIMNDHNEISDIALYTLGLIGDEYVDEIVGQFDDDSGNVNKSEKKWSYEDIIGTECKVILNSSCYKQNKDTGEWEDWRQDPLRLALLYEDAYSLKITGIIRPDPDATAHMLTGTIGYTYKLTNHIVEEALKSDVVKAQKAEQNQHTDILTGLPFETSKDALSPSQKTEIFKSNFQSLSDADKIGIYGQAWAVDNAETIEQGLDRMIEMTPYNVLLNMIASMIPGTDADSLRSMLPEDEDEAKAVIVNQVKPYFLEWYTEQAIAGELDRLQKAHADDPDPAAGVMQEVEEYFRDKTELQFAAYYDATTVFSDSTLEDNLAKMGCVDLSTPTAINIYASSFDAKDVIAAEIERYNNEIAEDESQQIRYTDFVALVMSAVTTIIDAVTYVLIAFVSISLIVSSIMIGVITLISVQERTKEIGILRAIGASKRDVSSMFNAETVIIGFASGLFGVLFTYVLCIPINLILHALTGISTLSAYLPPLAALILVAISVGLTLISGLIPSRSAAKKDPVTALRTE